MKVKHDTDRLEVVLIHQPGKEIEQLMPGNLTRLLFDDVPFLDQAIKEHQTMTDYLIRHDVKVFDITDLAAEILTSESTKNELINIIIHDLKQQSLSVVERVINKLKTSSSKEMVGSYVEGITYKELDLENKDTFFILDPLPNLLFQRDPMFMIHDICVISKMNMEARRREADLSKFVIKHHPLFKHQRVIDMTDQDNSIEGGDIIVLDDYIFIGLSERTTKEAVIELNKRLKEHHLFYKVILIELPNHRSYMHLDTVFTAIKKDVFVYDKHAFENSNFYELKDSKLMMINQSFETFMKHQFGFVTWIEVGDGDQIYAKREQWNDAANTLAIKPNHIICYDRNVITNQLFKTSGVTFFPMPSSELSRGRGGPHCMTMPLHRKSL
jgi:arginine deiminase